jgi:hypothetical protein
LEDARRQNLHDQYICCDVRQLSADAHFDVVVASHIIEHLPRDDGPALLLKMEQLATRLVYVETPLGFPEQPGHSGNPFQQHLSAGSPTISRLAAIRSSASNWGGCEAPEVVPSCYQTS